MAPATYTSVAPLPFLYSAFFLYIEPVSTAVGAYYAHYRKQEYMDLTLGAGIGQSASLFPSVTTREDIVLTQLANLYLVFALSEALVLRSTTDSAVWRTFLLGLLIADFGHLYSCSYIGWEIFYQPWTWNAIYWGNIGFVYVGASMRTAFLLGIGLSKTVSKSKVKV